MGIGGGNVSQFRLKSVSLVARQVARELVLGVQNEKSRQEETLPKKVGSPLISKIGLLLFMTSCILLLLGYPTIRCGR